MLIIKLKEALKEKIEKEKLTPEIFEQGMYIRNVTAIMC